MTGPLTGVPDKIQAHILASALHQRCMEHDAFVRKADGAKKGSRRLMLSRGPNPLRCVLYMGSCPSMNLPELYLRT